MSSIARTIVQGNNGTILTDEVNYEAEDETRDRIHNGLEAQDQDEVAILETKSSKDCKLILPFFSILQRDIDITTLTD
jgi:hypothetical protein